VKALIFDMDGLMIDSEKLYYETERELARYLGREVSDSTLQKMMGRTPVESMQVFIDDLGLDISPDMLVAMRQKEMERKLRERVEPMDGLHELVQAASSHFTLAIATGSPRHFVDIVLIRLDLDGAFSVVQTSETVTKGKPDPEIYDLTVQKLGFDAGQCIVLEDSHNGALAAKRAGCYCIAVPSRYTRNQDFSFVDYVASWLGDAHDHILEMLEER
jgi:HAD superfamily hydrolase (TIGR01509 family)